MVEVKDLRKISRARLKDAEILLKSRRYDGAVYLCGYAVELALKARICRALKWSGYPSTNAEFKGYGSFRTHDLDVLLHLSGSERKVKTSRLAEWSVAAAWDPNVRYRTVGTASAQDARDMLTASKAVIASL